MEEVLKKVSDTVVQQPVQLEVDIRPAGRAHAWLQRIGLMPRKRTLTISPITFGNLIRASDLILGIDPKRFNMDNLLQSNYEAIRDHGQAIARIVAIAIHNGRKEPPAGLIRFILDHFTSHELMTVMSVVLRQMNISDFMTTIISVRGLNVLQTEMSPADQGSQIAPGISSAE